MSLNFCARCGHSETDHIAVSKYGGVWDVFPCMTCDCETFEPDRNYEPEEWQDPEGGLQG